MDPVDRNFSFGESILMEVLHAYKWKKHTGQTRQLRTLGILGKMESGKSTLMNQLNLWSNANIKIAWDDKSKMKLKQVEIDEFTKIRHIWEGHTIMLLIAAHRFFLLERSIREMCDALVWLSMPPPWAMDEEAYLQAFFGKNQIVLPQTPFTALIVWRNWVSHKSEWGWFSWKNIPAHMADWTQLGFQHEAKNEMDLPYIPT